MTYPVDNSPILIIEKSKMLARGIEPEARSECVHHYFL
jgi:hypothetical protein